MKVIKSVVVILIIGISACVQPRCFVEEDSYHIPSNYEFTNGDGQNTVGFNGQVQRLEMLEEMTTYLKTANTSGIAVDAATLKEMYANNGYTWIDEDGLGMTGSSKQLKDKTAAATGVSDPAIQAYFENLMDEIGTLSASTTTGANNGTQGTGGVVVSSTDDSKQYLFNAEGKEITQLIEKGLMGAVFYHQIVVGYLGDEKMDVDNITAVDPANGKYYTEMEHHWDEAYGYFTTATNYPDNGADRFWGKYTADREDILGSSVKIGNAFRKGRAAISNKDMDTRDEQIATIRTELEKVVAGTAIHYLNDAMGNFTDDALRNHELSEAEAFIQGLIYGFEPIANSAQTNTWLAIIGNDFYEVTLENIKTVRDELAAAAGLSDVKEIL